MSQNGKEMIKTETTSLINQQQEKSIEQIKQPTSFIPSMSVTYKTSKAFEEGKAKIGDFYLEEQSLGTTISVVVLGYNYMCIARGETGEFIAKLILHPSDVSFRDNPQYIEFAKKHATDNLEEGVDILCFLPDHNLFGAFFAKKKLTEGGLEMLKMGGGQRILKVTTVKQTNKKETLTWFTLSVNATPDTAETIKDKDEKLDVFKKSIVEDASEEENKSQERDR